MYLNHNKYFVEMMPEIYYYFSARGGDGALVVAAEGLVKLL